MKKEKDFESIMNDIKEARRERVAQGFIGRKYNTKKYRRTGVIGEKE